MHKSEKLVVVAITSLLLSACGAKNLYVASRTIIGLNAEMDKEQATGHMKLGYNRDFLVVAPKSVPDKDVSDKYMSDKKDAMSVYSCTDMEVTGIYLTKFNEILATGEAAQNIGATLPQNDVLHCLSKDNGNTAQKAQANAGASQ